MLGFIRTVGVIAQMATLSLGYDTRLAMAIGLFACIVWIAHSLKNNDRWLLITNAVVAAFAVWGIA